MWDVGEGDEAVILDHSIDASALRIVSFIA